MVGVPSVVREMVANDRRTKRYSGLSCFLTGSAQGGDAE